MRNLSKVFLASAAFMTLALSACKPEKDNSISLDQRMDAAQKTAQNSLACIAIQPFYWEIGDKNSKLDSAGRLSALVVNPNVPMDIASASKLIFSTYALQKLKAQLNDDDRDGFNDVQALTMTSGYHSLQYLTCLLSPTAGACYHFLGNDKFTAADKGKFSYSAGHLQRMAVDRLGMGNFTNAMMGQAYTSELGLPFAFSSPNVGGGLRIAPEIYSQFLRKLLRGDYYMSSSLGAMAVPTNTGGENPSQGLGQTWQYSLGHWVESDPEWGDDSYSSPGAFGFYPWVDKDLEYYGIIARYSPIPGAHNTSVKCGQRIRAAWMTGLVPPANF